MSSNNLNVHPDYDPNIRIKDDPESLSQSSESTNPAAANLLKTIKTEPGFPTPTTTRLPSFRVPRDLTLGGNIKLEKPKKVYTPNLNAQRIKDREDANSNKNDSTPKGSRGRGRERGKNDRGKDRGKGRGKAANNIVQSSGIFSEGLSNLSTKTRQSSGVSSRDGSGGGGGAGGGGGGRNSAATLEKQKLTIPEKVNKAKEAETLKELLRDDFIDDGLDVDIKNTPIILPMLTESKLFKTEKHESINSRSKEEDDSSFLQNGDVKMESKSKVYTPQTKVKETKAPLTVLQVMESAPSSFFLMQVPNCLPGLSQIDDKQNDPRSKKAPEVSAENNETDKTNKFCTLNNLQEGMLGKLQILSCGSARLKLGENDLIVDVGSNLSFRQDVIAAKITEDKQSGDLVNLGLINSILICSPDWENMLKKL